MNRSFVIFGFLLLCGLGQAGEVPKTLHLTWEGDPCTTMTAQWLRGPGLGDRPEKGKGEEVRWKMAGDPTWYVVRSTTTEFPDPQKMGMPRWSISRVRWKGLEAGQEYVFQVGDSPEQSFRTAPLDMGEELIFAEGGDSDSTQAAEEMLTLACQKNPLFFSLGGDISYSDGKDVAREIRFWEMWHRVAHGTDGKLIPFVPGIGNHEVQGGYWQEGATFEDMKKKAPFFFALFGGLYQRDEPIGMDFGNYLSLLLLDTGHITPMKRQTEWLEKNLAARKSVPWVFVSWHIACYPSARTWNAQPMSGFARSEWIPLIEKSDATAIFNHHDHDMQRVESEGKGGRKVMVLGNGSIGVEPREAACQESIPMRKAYAQENYVNIVTLRKKSVEVVRLGRKGRELDRVELSKQSK